MAEKRILVTKLAAEYHEELLKTEACNRGFHDTGTWMLVAHLERDEFGNTFDQTCTEEENEVKL